MPSIHVADLTPKPTMFRYDVINALIEKFGYERYLEIGVRNGECLRAVNAPMRDGVDPNATLDPEGVNHPMTSDEFFAGLPESQTYDIVFIDGLHQRDQVLRDVENSLRHLSTNGTIVLHDCDPPTEYHATHESNGGDWNGTVYQAILDLRSRRTDLEIFTIGTDWGVGVIRRGEATTIDATLAEAAILDFAVFAANRATLLNLISVERFQEWLTE